MSSATTGTTTGRQLVPPTRSDGAPNGNGRPPRATASTLAHILRAMAEVIAAVIHRDDPSEVPDASIRRRIQRCLRDRALDVHFQPIVDLRDGRVVAVEALSRFPDEPRQGPHVWFADAAQVGLGTEPETLAIDRALDEARLLPDGISLALNASADVVLDERITSLVGDGRVPVDTS